MSTTAVKGRYGIPALAIVLALLAVTVRPLYAAHLDDQAKRAWGDKILAQIDICSNYTADATKATLQQNRSLI